MMVFGFSRLVVALGVAVVLSSCATGPKSAIEVQVEHTATPAQGAAIATDHVRLVSGAMTKQAKYLKTPAQMRVGFRNLEEANMALARVILRLSRTKSVTARDAERLQKAISEYNTAQYKTEGIRFFLQEDETGKGIDRALLMAGRKWVYSSWVLDGEYKRIRKQVFAVTGDGRAPDRTAAFLWAMTPPQVTIYPSRESVLRRFPTGLHPQLKAYEEKVNKAIGDRWQALLAKLPKDRAPGVVDVLLFIENDGSINKGQLIMNTSENPGLAAALIAIRQAKVPPIPEELLPYLKYGHLEYFWRSTLY